MDISQNLVASYVYSKKYDDIWLKQNAKTEIFGDKKRQKHTFNT